MSLQKAPPVILTVANHSKIVPDRRSERRAQSCAQGAANCVLVAITLVTLGGCSFFGKTPEVVVPPAPVAATLPAKPTALTPNALAALVQARSNVAIAAERAALWTTATAILKQAEAAAALFDSPLTTKLADEVSALCAVSVKQATYPPLSWQ